MCSPPPPSSGQVPSDAGSSASIDLPSLESNDDDLCLFQFDDNSFAGTSNEYTQLLPDAIDPRLHSSEATERSPRPQPSRQDWETQSATIKALYLDQRKNIKQIIRIMQDEHGFYASEKQYQARFRKWQVHKNLNSEIMRQILRIRKRRKDREGKDTEFIVWDKPVPRDKITRFVKRHGDTATADILASGSTPPCMTYHTPRAARSRSVADVDAGPAVPTTEAQTAFTVSSTLSMDYSFDTLAQNSTQDDLHTLARSDQSATRRVPLGLTQLDLNDITSLPDASSGIELQQTIQRIQLLAQQEPTRDVLCRRCNRCGFLPGPANHFPNIQSYTDLRDPSLVSLLQFAIKYNAIDVVKGILNHCQHSKFTQRVHPSLLCTALHRGRTDLFRWLLLHGIGASADLADASQDLLTQARMTMRHFIDALVERGGGEPMDSAVGFLYRARVITETVWRTSVLWKALRHQRPGVLRECLRQPNGAVLPVDDLMDKADDIRKIIRDTRCSKAANVLVAALEELPTVSELTVMALHLATALLLPDEVRRILAAGADVNAAMANGETPLHILAGLSDDGLSVARILLGARANVAATDSVGDTPMHNALRHDWVGWRRTFVSGLRQAGASIHAKNERGETPRITAALNMKLASAPYGMQWCLDNGACPQATDNADNTAQLYYNSRVYDNTQRQRQVDDFCALPTLNQLLVWRSTASMAEAWSVWPLELENLPTTSPRLETLQNRYGSVYEDLRDPMASDTN